MYRDIDVELTMENVAWLAAKVAKRLQRHARTRAKATSDTLEALRADVEELQWNLDSCERLELQLRLSALHLAAVERDFATASEARRVLRIIQEATALVRSQLDEALETLEEFEDEEGDA